MKNVKLKELSKKELHETEGRVRTENMFVRDTKMAKMFVEYMESNVEYMKRYEDDTALYEHIQKELDTIGKTLVWIDECFKKHQEDGLI